jgi:hypothetical protein
MYLQIKNMMGCELPSPEFRSTGWYVLLVLDAGAAGAGHLGCMYLQIKNMLDFELPSTKSGSAGCSSLLLLLLRVIVCTRHQSTSDIYYSILHNLCSLKSARRGSIHEARSTNHGSNR